MKIKKDGILIQHSDILNMITKFNNIMLLVVSLLLLLLAFFAPLLSALGIIILVGLNILGYVKFSKDSIIPYILIFVYISLLGIINTLYTNNIILSDTNIKLREQNKVLNANYEKLIQNCTKSYDILEGK